MSRKTVFLSSIIGVVARLGGSHLTREARERTAAKFAEAMFSCGYTHLARPSDIGGKQVRAYVGVRKKEGAGVRTLQNELAHIRSILRAAGRDAVASAPELANANLGVSGGSRLGSKTAMSMLEYEQVLARADRQERPGMGVLISLERHLGLRGNEAIHARPDTLERWKRELSTDGRVTVLAGTKGGRPRVVSVAHRQPALAAVERAIKVAGQQAGFLVLRANGKPAGGLKQARRIYHSRAYRSGIRPHAARYAFARDQLDAYLAAGYSTREALIAVSHDLGHGEGRGRWVKSVYMR